MRWLSHRRAWMLAGFVAAGAGDWFLAIKGSPRASPGFAYGVLCFALAQALWATGQLREARPDWRMALALAIPLCLFSAVRVAPTLPPATGVAVCAYAALTAYAFSLAYATRRVFYAWGIGLLCFSDVMIGFGLLYMPGCHALVGPTYVAAEACLLVSLLFPRERRFDPSRRNPWPAAAIFGSTAFMLFALAATCPAAMEKSSLQFPSRRKNKRRFNLSSISLPYNDDVSCEGCFLFDFLCGKNQSGKVCPYF